MDNAPEIVDIAIEEMTETGAGWCLGTAGTFGCPSSASTYGCLSSH